MTSFLTMFFGTDIFEPTARRLRLQEEERIRIQKENDLAKNIKLFIEKEALLWAEYFIGTSQWNGELYIRGSRKTSLETLIKWCADNVQEYEPGTPSYLMYPTQTRYKRTQPLQRKYAELIALSAKNIAQAKVEEAKTTRKDNNLSLAENARVEQQRKWVARVEANRIAKEERLERERFLVAKKLAEEMAKKFESNKTDCKFKTQKNSSNQYSNGTITSVDDALTFFDLPKRVRSEDEIRIKISNEQWARIYKIEALQARAKDNPCIFEGESSGRIAEKHIAKFQLQSTLNAINILRKHFGYKLEAKK